MHRRPRPARRAPEILADRFAPAGDRLDLPAGGLLGASAHKAQRTLEVAVDNADRVLQVLTNPLSNAINFSPPESCVTICHTASGRDVLFDVIDRGRGVPADKLAAMFGRFQPVDPAAARGSSGTGPGLAISRSIVEQHGGRIRVESVRAAAAA